MFSGCNPPVREENGVDWSLWLFCCFFSCCFCCSYCCSVGVVIIVIVGGGSVIVIITAVVAAVIIFIVLLLFLLPLLLFWFVIVVVVPGGKSFVPRLVELSIAEACLSWVSLGARLRFRIFTLRRRGK